MKALSKVVILSALFLLITTSNVFAQEMALMEDGFVKKGVISTGEPINLTEEHKNNLPYEAKKFVDSISKNEELVATAATIHIFKNKEEEIEKISSKNYDLSKLEELKNYKSDIALLESDKQAGLKAFGIEPNASDNHYGHITTGLNATKVYGSSYDSKIQLHGWWDWHTMTYLTEHDKLGLVWTDFYNSSESSHNAYANRDYDNRTIYLPKHNYQDADFFNKGVLWDHNTGYRTSGAALAQIQRNNISNHYVGLEFEYVAPGGPTSDDWRAISTQLIFDYYGITTPPIPTQRFDTFVQVYVN